MEFATGDGRRAHAFYYPPRNSRFTVPAALDPSAGVNTFQLSFSIGGKTLEHVLPILHGPTGATFWVG